MKSSALKTIIKFRHVEQNGLEVCPLYLLLETPGESRTRDARHVYYLTANDSPQIDVKLGEIHLDQQSLQWYYVTWLEISCWHLESRT